MSLHLWKKGYCGEAQENKQSKVQRDLLQRLFSSQMASEKVEAIKSKLLDLAGKQGRVTEAVRDKLMLC